MSLKVLIFVIVLNPIDMAWAKPNCNMVLAESHGYDSSLSVTENFISYLDRLESEHLIRWQDLKAMFEESQKQGKITLAFDKYKEESSQLSVHLPILQHYLEQELEQKQVLTWLESIIAKKQNIAKEKDKSVEDTVNANLGLKHWYPIKMTKIPRIASHMNSVPPQEPHEFAMMPTVITYDMWIKVMGRAPENSRLTGDYPVVNVTWWSMLEFANRLSRLHGLPEVYDLSKVKLGGGSAEAGALKAAAGEPIINAVGGDIYKAEGYRLPSMHELLFVLANGEDPIENTYFPGTDDSNILEYAWLQENSNGQLKSVAEKKPYIIQGHELYDLDGNVELASYHYWVHESKVSTVQFIGTAYQFSKTLYSNGIVRRTSTANPNFGDDKKGFRLVRSVRNGSR